MTRPVKFVLALLQISCGGATNGLAAGDADAQGDAGPQEDTSAQGGERPTDVSRLPHLDGALPACITALALVMGGCTDAGSTNLTDSGTTENDSGMMAATGLRDGGQQSMMDTQSSQPEVQIGAQDASPKKDTVNMSVPTTQDVISRLKSIPKGVIFVGTSNVGGPPAIYLSFTQAYRIDQHVIPSGSTYDEHFEFETTNMTGKGPRGWVRAVFGEFTPKTPLTDAELARMQIPKEIRDGGQRIPPVIGRALSIDDWISSHQDNLDEAIANP
jgi:hypothetical protein